MKKIATITTDPTSGDGSELLHELSEDYELDIDTRHGDGQATFVIQKEDIEVAFEDDEPLEEPDGVDQQEIDEAMERIAENMDSRDYENIDPEEYTK